MVQNREPVVVPVNGEGVETERTEIIEVLQLAADAFLHERREVHQADFARHHREPDILPSAPMSRNRMQNEHNDSVRP